MKNYSISKKDIIVSIVRLVTLDIIVNPSHWYEHLAVVLLIAIWNE